MREERILTTEKRAAMSLRALYRDYGYQPFRMSRFEEYDFYARNKDFLVSDQIITFTDSRGKLMALKPDVTLSILKSGKDQPGCRQKLCYSENVFRVSSSSGQFREIMQAGLECIGDLDAYDSFEVVALAVKSLALLGKRSILNLSHLGLLNALLDGLGGDGRLKAEVSRCIAGRSVHELRALCRAAGCAEDQLRELCFFADLYAPLADAPALLAPCCESESARAALAELKTLQAMLRDEGLDRSVMFDFSVVNNRKYYNGLVFQGFLEGVAESVLAGGQYDRLMERMGRKASGLGFAVYLDRLEADRNEEEATDVDVLLLYSDAFKAAEKVRALRAAGKSVSAQRAVPEKLRWRDLIDLRGGESNA